MGQLRTQKAPEAGGRRDRTAEPGAKRGPAAPARPEVGRPSGRRATLGQVGGPREPGDPLIGGSRAPSDLTPTRAAPSSRLLPLPPPPKRLPVGSHPASWYRALLGQGRRLPPALSAPAPHHFRTFSMAAITFLMSSLARLRVSARTDRPDMAAAGAAGAGALLPRHGESRASRAAARPPQQRHSGSLPLRARVREEARAPTRLLGLKASARLRAPPRASLPRRPGSPLGPHAGRDARRPGGTCCWQGEVRGATGGVPGCQVVWM